MPRLLKNIDVDLISLVGAGANGKALILKSKDAKTPNFNHQIKILKSDSNEGLIYATVYSPNEIDTHGDFSNEIEIKKSAHNFLQKSNTFSVDVEHNGEAKNDTFVAESYILKTADTEHFPNTPINSWVTVIKTNSEEIKEKIAKGEITGASLAGTAIVQEVDSIEKAQKTLFEQVQDLFENAWMGINIDGRLKQISKNFKGNEMQKEEIEKAIQEKLQPLAKKIEDMQIENEKLLKENEEMSANLLKSKQKHTFTTIAKDVDVVKMAIGG